MGRSSRWSRCRRTPGTSVVSSTRSCSRGRRGRIRSSPASSARRCRRNHPPEAVESGRPSKRRNSVAEFFPADKLFLIAGPCVLESDELNLRVGEALARLAEKVPGGIIYKASFDKANRSNRNAARGPGLSAGLEALERVRRATGLPVLTDVHTPDQCAPAASVVDVLQIPAFLCRQTDLLEAAGATGKPVNVKKGQWLQPEGMRGAVQKVRGGTSAKGR